MEYQKDLPDMDHNITAEELKVPDEIFKVALNKLTSEGLIKGGVIELSGSEIYLGSLHLLMMTPDGIEYVEQKALIEKNLKGIDKVKAIMKKVGEWGLTELENFGAKVLAEMANHA